MAMRDVDLIRGGPITRNEFQVFGRGQQIVVGIAASLELLRAIRMSNQVED